MKYVLTSIVIFLFGFFGFLNPLKSVFLTLFSPVQFGLHKSATVLIDGTHFFSGVFALRAENIKYREKILELESQVSEFKKVAEENYLLRNQLNLSKSLVTKKMVLASAMGNPSDPSGSFMLIDKGSKDGVITKSPVILENNLIGIIQEVGYSTSTVELITSSSLSYIVYDIDSKDKTQALAVGKHGSSIGLDRILPQEEIKVGDTIVTSGREGLLWPGFIVGKVESVSQDPSLPLKTASVKSVIDFSQINKVFVLVGD